jgi:hypothetical protein
MSELTRTFRVDPEFRDRIPAPNADAFKGLEADILSDGAILDPLKVWAEEGILLDGHHRYTISQTHGLPYAVHLVSLPDRESALDWIDRHAIHQRNLPADLESLIRGRIYNRAKKTQGGKREANPQSGDLKNTSEILASELGVSKNTLQRDGAFAAAVDKLGIAQEVTQGTVAAPRSKVIDAAKDLPAKPTTKQKAKAREQLETPVQKSPSVPKDVVPPAPKPKDDRDARISELTRLLADSKAENEALRDQNRELASSLRSATEDNESMDKILRADNSLMSLMNEVGKFKELARVTKSRNDGLMVEVNQLKGFAKSWKRKFDLLERKTKGLEAEPEEELELETRPDESDYHLTFDEVG